MRRPDRALYIVAGIASHAMLASAAAILCLELAVRVTPMPGLERAARASELVTAASGETLWAFHSADDRWRLPVAPHAVSSFYRELLLLVEDRRFAQHRGVDVLALARAARLYLRHGRTISGASTLTMQVVRLLQPRPRTLTNKLAEMLQALRLERSLDKQEIFRLYLTLAPFGGNIEGVRAASLIYFGKEPSRLTLAEAALLVAIPQAPETRRPDRHQLAARAARQTVLRMAEQAGLADGMTVRRAADAALPIEARPLARHAYHLAQRLTQQEQRRGQPFSTLINASLQAHVESVAKAAIKDWGREVSIAAIVIRNDDGAVVAYMGSVDPHSAERRGFVDLVQALRSPGSALKPLVYAMAFERLAVHPETIIPDRPVHFEGYRPENADGRFAGDMSVREALIKSRNTAAVMLLDRIGITNFLSRFRTAGRPLLLPGSDAEAGLAIALGGVGVTLEQLTWFYSAIASDGRLKALRWLEEDRPAHLGTFITEPAARATADILADVPPPPGLAKLRAADGGRRVAFKTGTSYGFRDAWAIGFDRLHTVGIWVGRADGAAHLGAYGATAAAPILLRVFDQLPLPGTDVSPARLDRKALSSLFELPDRLKRFRSPAQEGAMRSLEIVFPRAGTELDIDRGGRPSLRLPLSVAGGTPPYHWTLNGVAQPPTLRAVQPATVDGKGQIEVSVTDAAGVVARGSFWLR